MLTGKSLPKSTSREHRSWPAILIRTVFLIAAVCRFANAHAESPDLKAATWAVPVSVKYTEATAPIGKTTTLPGFKETDIPGQYDATEFAKAMGATFPEGSESIFDQASTTLFIRNTPNNLEKIEFALSKSKMPNAPFTVAMDLSFYECSLPEPSFPDAAKWPTVEELKSLPKESRTLLLQATGTARTGERVVIQQNVGATEERKKSSLLAIYEPENVEFPSGTSNSLDLQWLRPDENGSRQELKFSTKFSSREGAELVLYMSQSEIPGKYYVVTGRPRIVPTSALALEKLKDIALKYPQGGR